MAAGVEFDPAEFAAFKSQGAPPARAAAPVSNGFDPAEFASFKAQRSPPPREAGRDPGALQIRVGRRQEPEAGPSFDERFGNGPMASNLDTSTPEGAALRAKADEALVGKPDGSTPFLAALYRAGNTAALNLPRNAAAGIATGLGTVGVPGYGNRSFSENYDLAKDQEEAFARQAPKSALAGTVGGIVGGALALPAWGGAATAARRAGQAAVTGGAYGLAAEAFDTKDADKAVRAGVIGFGLGGSGGYALEKLAPVVMGSLRKASVPFRDQTGQLTAEARAAMQSAGIDPTDITPELAARLEQAFTVKGPSPAAAREAVAADQGITLSRGQATLDPRSVDLERGALAGSRGPRAENIGQEFATRQAGEVDAARGRLQGMAARGEPLIDNPQTAFEAAADRARMAGGDAARRVAAAQRAQDEALQAVRRRGQGDALDGATAAIQGVRDAAERSRGAYRAAYDEVAQIPGEFTPGALDRMGTRMRARLGADVPIDDVLTPSATRAIADLDAVPGLFNLEPGAGPNLQQVDQLRKRLVAYRGATAQNPTDRRAMDRILREFDDHVTDAMDLGQFGQRTANGADAGADDFPGSAAIRALDAPADAITMPAGPAGSPETMGRFMARNGGVQMTGDARALDLHRAYYPGAGTLGRRDGIPLDQWRVKLTEAGYLPPAADGEAAQEASNRIMDALRAERIGQPHYRIEDEARVGGSREAGRIAEDNAAHADAVSGQARRMAIEFDGMGLRSRDLDGGALHEAAERMVLGHADDAATAYEQAVARRGVTTADDDFGARSSTPHDAPFPEVGEAASVRAPDVAGFPAGDTAPAEAMRNARGLFRAHKQAFAPRGPGDVAGQRLQKIVERDASPNDVVTALFGTTTGRVSSGQIQTLTRLRSAVGTDSEAWGAVQNSIVARYISGDGRDLAGRLDYLLRGEGRTIATQFLSDEQRRGLGQLRAAISQTEAAHTAAPAWVADLERSGFDPTRIASSLFGSGVPGAKVGAMNEARAAKAFLGADSAEWSMLRQAAVQKLTDPSLSAAKTVERLGAFTNGPGAGVARELFSPEELAQVRRFSGALRATILPDGSMRPGGERTAGVAAKALDVLAGMVAFKVGGLPAAAGTYGAKVGQRALVGGIGAAKARRSFESGAPRMTPPPVALPLGRLGAGAGLEAAEAY
ncbi:hypothetical protein [Methylobacterium sp. WL6]|uniref:hypothetical protein n=1 Tax=Methylobacterium sp. WL6 TaxID=2603901 RepID=UPI0011CAAEC7|nr:hypothetical protein [Methylobacterium sp. WL6]TXN73430.1 hypothetical protein FV230_01275 [Methylobacterium sp. WL6]